MAKLYGLNNAVDFAAKNLINFTSIFARSAGQPLDKTSIWYPAYVDTSDNWNVVAETHSNAELKSGYERALHYAGTDAAYVGQIIATINIKSVTPEGGGEAVTEYEVEVYKIEANGTLTSLSVDRNLQSTVSEIQTNIGELESQLDDFVSNSDFNDYKQEISNKGYATTGEVNDSISTLKGSYTGSLSDLEESLEASIATEIAKYTHFDVLLVHSVSLNDNKIQVNSGDSYTNAKYGTIYLVKDDSVSGDDIYKEYMLVNVGDKSTLVLTGTTSTDLSQYSKTDDVVLKNDAPYIVGLQTAINSLNSAQFGNKYVLAFDTNNENAAKIESLNSILNDYATSSSLNTLSGTVNKLSGDLTSLSGNVYTKNQLLTTNEFQTVLNGISNGSTCLIQKGSDGKLSVKSIDPSVIDAGELN